MQFTNPFPIAAADNPPAGIHHVDVGIDDAHRPRHNILRHFGIKMPASHVILPLQGTSIKESLLCCIVHMPEARVRYVELWKRSQNESPCPRRGKGLESER